MEQTTKAPNRLYRLLALFCLAVLSFPAATAGGPPEKGGRKSCPQVRLEAERLPDLNVPRSGHQVLCVNGEVVVFGGHTTGFLPTATAEYLDSDGWHLKQMTYTHDHGLAMLLKSGKVFLAGGCNEPLGIGQHHATEWYDPATHTFEGFGCLDTKRSIFAALEVDSGCVAIAGNWFGKDDIELFDGKRRFTHFKTPTIQRGVPFVFRSADGDVTIFSSKNTHDVPFDSVVADRLKGEPFRIPLLEKWHPIRFDLSLDCGIFAIGDEAKDEYSYLFAAYDDNGKMAIVHTDGTRFKLLPTLSEIPTTFHGNTIIYGFPIADRLHGRFYIGGMDSTEWRFYMLSVEYKQSPARLTLYYTDPLQIGYSCVPVLTTDGDIVISGGFADDNFHPMATVYRIMTGPNTTTSASDSIKWWWLLLGGLGLLAIVLTAYLYYTRYTRARKRRIIVKDDIPDEEIDDRQQQDELMQRICQLMDDEQPFLDSNLKVQDIADLLGSNRTYVSDCINTVKGCTFNQFVNTYRVRYAQQLLRHDPKKKVSSVCLLSGFANEMTFFRAFKRVTGQTPREWAAGQNREID